MKKSAKERYEALAVRREPFLRRARDYAELTIPTLMPPEGQSGWHELPETYQNFSARCVTGLASHLMGVMLPKSQRGFRLMVPAEVLMAEGMQSLPDNIEKGLALSEQLVSAEIERKRWRGPTYVGLQQLIVTGTILEQTLPDNRIKTYRLDQFVVVRDPTGMVIEVVIEEFLSPNSLPPELQGLLDVTAEKDAPSVPLYTWVIWNARKGVWEVQQELNDRLVPKSKGVYEVSPFRAVRWCPVLGEDYGRSKVEEHRGDLMALEGLSKSAIDGAAMASRHITTIKPNSAGGLNLRRRLSAAKNGDVIIADPDDIGMVQFQNASGLQIAIEERRALMEDLAAAFLLNSSARRDAERVTAYEVRKMIDEIESVLGGVYTTISEEMQSPRMERLIYQMRARQQLPAWPDGMVEPTVLTGIDALDREKDVEKAQLAMQFLAALTPEERMRAKMDVVMAKFFSGIDLPDAVKTEDEYQAELAQQQQMAAAQQIAGNIDPQALAAAAQ